MFLIAGPMVLGDLSAKQQPYTAQQPNGFRLEHLRGSRGQPKIEVSGINFGTF